MSRRVNILGSYSGFSPGFNPLNIRGLQIYLNVRNATPASWLDQSPNAFDFAQPVVTRQPTVTATTVSYDGFNDYQEYTSIDEFGADTSGIIFFSGTFDNTSQNYIFSSSDTSSLDNFFLLSLETKGLIAITTRVLGSTSLSFTTDIIIPNGTYYYGYLKSNGSFWEININGSIAALSGNNTGNWFGDVPSRNNLVLSAFRRSSDLYRISNQNKLIYSNASLTAGEISDVLNFMAIESN